MSESINLETHIKRNRFRILNKSDLIIAFQKDKADVTIFQNKNKAVELNLKDKNFAAKIENEILHAMIAKTK